MVDGCCGRKVIRAEGEGGGWVVATVGQTRMPTSGRGTMDRFRFMMGSRRLRGRRRFEHRHDHSLEREICLHCASLPGKPLPSPQSPSFLNLHIPATNSQFATLLPSCSHPSDRRPWTLPQAPIFFTPPPLPAHSPRCPFHYSTSHAPPRSQTGIPKPCIPPRLRISPIPTRHLHRPPVCAPNPPLPPPSATRREAERVFVFVPV